ncbi:MAG: hypothetical protein PHQ36_13695 [Anaerolineales bacterium]|nr:hypothetical protein [Anaerolineales bacterium]
MPLFCVLGGAAVVAIALFFYLLNTARRKISDAANIMGKKDYAPVYISIADKPDAILRGMDRFVAETSKTETAGDKWRWIPMLIFFAGAGLMAVDLLILLFGYVSFVFTGGGLALWIAAFVMALSLRKSDSRDFAPRYYGLKEVLRTLRDDLKPNTTFLGHLDLTGALLNTKVARESKDARDRTTQYFRDEWLSLKAKLYDGNILRVSAVQKSKKRKSYMKRSRISGKYKTKPEKFKGAQHDLKVRIVVNPQAYQITPNANFKQGQKIGKYAISQLSTADGMINFVASSSHDEVEYEQILQVLKSAYSLLQRKAA